MTMQLRWGEAEVMRRALDLATKALVTASLAWCLAAGVLLWVTPVQRTGVRWEVRPNGARAQPVVSLEPFSAVSPLGALPLVAPVVLAGGAAWAAWRRRWIGLTSATLLLLAYILVTGFSIGEAYQPAGWLLVLAILLASLRRSAPVASA